MPEHKSPEEERPRRTRRPRIVLYLTALFLAAFFLLLLSYMMERRGPAADLPPAITTINQSAAGGTGSA